MKKLLTQCAVLAFITLTPVSVKADNHDWFGSILGNILGNSGLNVSIGNQNPAKVSPQVRYQFHPASAYIKQCLNVPRRYVDRYGNYHDYSRVECRMILRGPYAGR